MLPVFSFTKAALELLIWLNDKLEFENGEGGLKASFDLFEDTCDLVFYFLLIFSGMLVSFYWLCDFGYYIWIY